MPESTSIQPLELILVRHAKTEPGLAGLSDFERALLPRGEADAAAMAQRLLLKTVQPDLIVSSPARRAIGTARIMAPLFNILPQNIVENAALYHATVDTWEEVIQHFPNDCRQLLVVGHNEGISELANQLTAASIDHLPTAGVFALRLQCQQWSEFQPDGSHECWFTDWPKNAG